MFEKLSQLFATPDVPLSPKEDVEKKAGIVGELEQELADAEATAATLRQQHNDNLLKSIADGNEPRTLKARRALADAEEKAADYRKGLENARNLLATATSVAAAADLAERWEHAAAMLKHREELVAKLQADLDTLAADFRAVLEQTAACTAALPVWLADSKAPISAARLSDAAMTYLAGKSNGAIGAKLAVSPMVVAAEFPSLITQAAGHTRMLLVPSNSHSTSHGEAA